MSENNFSVYNLSNEILKALELLNYKEASNVQQKVIPEVLSKKDIRVKAATGSGKTAAFGIPICEKVDWLKNKPQALILVPTRELAIQVAEELRSIGRLKRLKVSAIFGKLSIDHQELELKQKTHIVVGTPGRIRDLISRGSLQLNEITYLVIDEADEMFYIGLKEQVEDIIQLVPKSRSTLLFSATLSDEIHDIVNQYMDNPIDIHVENQTKVTDQIEQLAYLVEEDKKFSALKYITMTKNPESCIIFANTQTKVDEIQSILIRNGYPIRSLHGGMQQKERMKIIEDFKLGIFRYLVATDVVARGIDIDKLSLVINYDMSRGLDNYVHRIGRTGRQRATGTAVTFYTSKEDKKLDQLEDYLKTDYVQTASTETCVDNLDTNTAIQRITDVSYVISESEETLFREKIKTVPILKQKKGSNVTKGITKLHINAGKKSKIRTNEIVATICSIEGIVDTDIGVIQITDLATFVEILNDKGNHVLQELKLKTIKGKIRKVNIARR